MERLPTEPSHDTGEPMKMKPAVSGGAKTGFVYNVLDMVLSGLVASNGNDTSEEELPLAPARSPSSLWPVELVMEELRDG